MNSLFRVCIIFCLLMLAFTLILNLITAVAPTAFPNTSPLNPDIKTQSGAMSILTGTSDGTLNGIWLGVTGLAFAGTLGLVYLTQSLAPVGIYLFGTIFWTSFVRLTNVLSFNGLVIPTELYAIFSVGLLFVFIGAIIGMMTGSG